MEDKMMFFAGIGLGILIAWGCSGLTVGSIIVGGACGYVYFYKFLKYFEKLVNWLIL